MPIEASPPLLSRARKIHLVGIGGSGMSSLASLLAAQGKQVQGSDLSADLADRFAGTGILTAIGHRAENLGDAEVVVASAAVLPDNPELVAARRLGVPVISHAQALGALMSERLGVGVAGTHGKTTTTAMLGHILTSDGKDPSVLVGARVGSFGSGARLGHGPHLIVEADEFDRRFLQLRPYLAIITSIEPDHLDYFKDLDEILQVYLQFVERIDTNGAVVTCDDDPILATLDLPRRRIRYGTRADAEWQLRAFQSISGGGCRFEVHTPGGSTRCELKLTGRHNALNAVGAIAAAVTLGTSLDSAATALGTFDGTERRFETVFRAGGIWVVDDYAHHPTAVRLTLGAAREVHQGRLWAVFQPHTSNRVAELFEEFSTCFEAADQLSLLPIYQPAGRHQGLRAVSSAELASAIATPATTLESSLESIEERLLQDLRPGDLALIMGAGDVTQVARQIALRLLSKP